MDDVRQAAIEVLRHNAHGPYGGLPRTAGWGYPEPYTRDWMISAPGILLSGDEELIDALRRMLAALAATQTPLGNIASLAHDPGDCGASDTTPLFLIALALFRSVTGETNFLEQAAARSLNWIQYQSPDDVVLVAQQPTSDWRDEQWVWGYGLYVNALTYGALRLHGQEERAQALASLINHAGPREIRDGKRLHEGLSLPDRPYYALWAYKVHRSQRFDLLGNSLAMVFGLPGHDRAHQIIAWVEDSTRSLKEDKLLACELPPCLMPFIFETEEDWLPRYRLYNPPGHYHNGGIWPFTVAWYIAALIASGQQALALQKFQSLSRLMEAARDPNLAYGFNEWFRAQDCSPGGQDWQTWTAAMYLYAAECVDAGRLLLLDARQDV
ncbi:MAG: glycoside hydrolase 100 family protein [Bacteroidota bacterium]